MTNNLPKKEEDQENMKKKRQRKPKSQKILKKLKTIMEHYQIEIINLKEKIYLVRLIKQMN